MTRTIYRERIPSTDPRLGRAIHHDSRSRAYVFDTSGLEIVSAKHTRRIDILDQGSLGACTGFAGVGCLGTNPYYTVLPPAAVHTLDGEGARRLYSDATRIDPYPGGWYEPEWLDTGSDGLSIAKVLKDAGEIAGYRWTFSLNDALKALGVTPFITGTYWYEAMFRPDVDGRVRIGGTVAGGHEYVADEIDAERERVWFTNSWGFGWGLTGRFYLTFVDYGTLLDRQGDVTIFSPLTEPAPVPPADADADAVFAGALRPWADQPHICGNARAAKAARAWLTATGL